MRPANRLENLPPYLFADIDRMVREEREKGKEIIKLGIGDPDLPTPTGIIEKTKEELEKTENHGYPAYDGIDTFKKAVKEYYKSRFEVELNQDEILALIGSKEGIANIFQAVLNPGDATLVPDPAYPVYKNATTLVGGTPYTMPLKEENDFLPDLNAVPEEHLQEAKLMFLNYPNNPTSAVADKKFFEEAVRVCKNYNILLCNDAAYAEIAYDQSPPSLLSVPGAKDVAVEFNSLSKPFNMTGWRVGFMVGNSKAVEALARYKTNIDSGVFTPIQLAAVYALENRKQYISEVMNVYRARRDVVVNHLQKAGFKVYNPEATFYVWVKVPESTDSFDFTKSLLSKTGIVVTPGIGFGRHGEGYFRIALTVPKETLEKAMEKISSYFS